MCPAEVCKAATVTASPSRPRRAHRSLVLSLLAPLWPSSKREFLKVQLRRVSYSSPPQARMLYQVSILNMVCCLHLHPMCMAL